MIPLGISTSIIGENDPYYNTLRPVLEYIERECGQKCFIMMLENDPNEAIDNTQFKIKKRGLGAIFSNEAVIDYSYRLNSVKVRSKHTWVTQENLERLLKK